MKFPHTITIFSKKLKAKVKSIEGVYWYGEKGISIDGRGIIKSDNITIFIPKGEAEGLLIEKGDRVVKGNVGDVNDWNDLNAYEDIITVKKIEDNRIGSELDNLVVIGE